LKQYKINNITYIEMRFKVRMINNQGQYYDETIISNNEAEAKKMVMAYNPNSRIIDAKWVYK